MTAVAELAEKSGYEVSGCDLEASTAYAKNILAGHNKAHVKNADLVIVSPAVMFSENGKEEVKEAKKEGKFMTWQEFVGSVLSEGKKVICVAGTHGKSTTTAMLGKLLTEADLDPSVLVGARVSDWNGNARYGAGEYFVLEADEFNDNFLNYSPEIIILNNIEFDHPDYFKNEKEVFESFKKFISRLHGMKILIANEDSEGVQKILKEIDKTEIKVITYSSKNQSLGFELSIPGKHNIANALGVATLAKFLNIDENIIKESLQNFKGIGRRMELIASRNGIEVYDDYAHHPTAIKATIDAIRENHPAARIWAIDEPHGFSRTNALINLYKGVFDKADKVLIGPIYKARDSETFGMTPQIVAQKSAHKDAAGYDSFEAIKKILEHELKSGDVVLVMGAGKSYVWAREIASILPISFSDLTTFHIGGSIKKYFEVRNEEEIKKAVSYSKSNKLPIFIIGGGSDILASDKEFDGVVIKFVGADLKINGDKITAEAGLSWDELVKVAVENNLQGIEALSGIPGTVGASPIQNIGAYGHELKETFESLLAYDIENNAVKVFSYEDCKFGYRESIFKNKDHWQKFIIISITLKLNKNGRPSVGYESLRNYLTNFKNPSIREIRDAVLKARRTKLENPQKTGNAGSFFKNPVITKKHKEKLLKEFPDMVVFPFENDYKVSAGWLIERAGWKGKNLGGAGVSSKHALILINSTGNAKAADIMALSEKIIDDVNKKFGLKLEREVQMINF